MEFTYFKLDENPRQFKNLSLGEYEINLRIEWNIRARCWYVLGYINNDLVLRNTKFSPNKVYNFDQDNDYDLPYNLMITTNFQNADWNDETLFVIFRDALANPVKGITDDYIVIDRSFATSSNTHSKRALRSETNKYLFDVKPLINDGVVTIICDGAGASFETIHLPQGRWDFTINGFKQNLAIVDGDYTNLYNALAPYGVHVSTLGDDRYTWVNSSDENVRIEAVYPYANGFDFNVDESSNDSIIVTGKDNNGWVNGFAVCLVPASSFTWNIQFQNVVNGVANYNGTQGIYKSTASLDLTNKVVQSFSNENLKDWQAVKDAANQLTGVDDWVLDPANNQIKYKVPGETSQTCTYGGQSCNNYCAIQAANSGRTDGGAVQYTDSYYGTRWFCQTSEGFRYAVITGAQTGTSTTEEEEKTIPLPTVAQQIISNSMSSSQGIALLAQTYLEEVAKTLVTVEDLISQLEANKTI